MPGTPLRKSEVRFSLFSHPLISPSILSATTLNSLKHRAQCAHSAIAAVALDLAPDAALPQAIATLETKLAASAAAVTERAGALEAVTRVGNAAKARLHAADDRVHALRARCEALDAEFVTQCGDARAELAAAV